MATTGTRDRVKEARTTVAAQDDLVASLNQRLDDTIAPLIPRDQPYALLDFPHTPNVGDSLIWLGNLLFLRRHGFADPVYACSTRTFSAPALAKRLPDGGTILLSGGGNFGDLYEPHQRLREAVLKSFPRHRIVQLAQTMYFESVRNLDRTRTLFDAHPNVTLLARDTNSLALARDTFRARSELCPDMAFAIGPLSRPGPVTDEVVWLARRDKESAGHSRAEPPRGVRRVEWLRDTPRPLIRWHDFLGRNLRHRAGLRPWLQGTLTGTYESVSRDRLERGSRMLSAGDCVITDRLHGHILCMLLGIPHVLIDNSYGKLRGFYETWTKPSPLAQWSDSEDDAIRLASEAAARPR